MEWKYWEANRWVCTRRCGILLIEEDPFGAAMIRGWDTDDAQNQSRPFISLICFSIKQLTFLIVHKDTGKATRHTSSTPRHTPSKPLRHQLQTHFHKPHQRPHAVLGHPCMLPKASSFTTSPPGSQFSCNIHLWDSSTFQSRSCSISQLIPLASCL